MSRARSNPKHCSQGPGFRRGTRVVFDDTVANKISPISQVFEQLVGIGVEGHRLRFDVTQLFSKRF